MSQQDNPQENPENAAAPEAASWSTPPASNRPAEGATRVVSLHHAEQTWNVGEGATDFLGLEQDGALGAPVPGQAAAEAGAPEVNPTQAWLFHMENEARGGAAATAGEPPSPALAAPEWSAESVLPEQGHASAAPLPGPDDLVQLGQELPQSTQEPEFALAAEEPSVDPRRQRKVQWLVAAGLAATLLFAGGWQIWYGNSKTKTPGTNDPIVWRSTNKKTPKPAPGSTTTKPAGEAPAVAVKPPVEQPGASTPNETPTPAPTPAQPDPTATAQATAPVEAPLEPPPAVPEGQPAASVAQPAPEQPLAQSDPQPEQAPPADFTPVAFPGSHPSDPASPLATPKGTRRPERSEIAGLWTAQAIPFDSIGAESMLRTPAVGAVRVLLKNGEHLQGRLYSVGQGHVSMDVALGRMSVDYSDVSDIVQILETDLTKKPSNGLPEETAGLLYVTAKVPGGYLTGWLVQRTEGKLTLITAQAKKITIDDEGFEPVPKGGARVVGTLGRDTTEAASPAPAPDNSIPKLQSGGPGPKTPAKPNAAKPNAPKSGAAKPGAPKPKG